MAFLPELDTRSVLDVANENFNRVGLKAFAIRMIYIGEHGCEKNDFIKQMRKVMNAVNSGYCDVNVTGLLLTYDGYFIHVIEGSEDTVHRQIRFMLRHASVWIKRMRNLDEENEKAELAAKINRAEEEGLTFNIDEWKPSPRPERIMFKRLKLLMVYHSISTLFFESWRAFTARPPSLIGTLDIYAPFASHTEQLRIALDKIKKLCNLACADDTLTFEGLSAVDPKIKALPEVALLDFLLESPHTVNLQHVLHLHRRVDDYCFYFEQVWPLPTHYTPRYLYKLKVDDSFVPPLPVMPWEVVKKEDGEEEEEREKESDSSSSD